MITHRFRRLSASLTRGVTPALLITAAAGAVLIMSRPAIASAQAQAQALSVPQGDDAWNHRKHVGPVHRAGRAEYRRVLQEYDAHLARHPNDGAVLVEKCRFIGFFSEAGYEMPEDADAGDDDTDAEANDFDACLQALRDARFEAQPLVQLYLLELDYSDEGITAGTKLVERSANWPPALVAQLHSHIASRYQIDGQEQLAATHAIRAVQLDPGSPALMLAAESLETLGRKEQALAMLKKAPASAWNEFTAGSGAKLLLRLGDPEAAFALLETHAKGDRGNGWLPMAEALAARGQIANARRTYLDLLRDDKAPGISTLRTYFWFERTHGSREEAAAAYARLRDEGFAADPFGRMRVGLTLAHPWTSWRIRDVLGVLALMAALAAVGLMPLLVIAPVHYWSLARRVRGVSFPAADWPWGLGHAWYSLAAMMVTMLVASYAVAYPSFEDYFGQGPYDGEPSDARALSRMFMLYLVLLAVACIPLFRRVTLPPSFILGRWPLRQSLWAATWMAFAFRVAASFWSSMTAEGASTALGSSTVQAMQGIYADFGLLALLLVVAVVVPVVEELVFRAVLLNSLARYIWFPLAALLQAVAFAAMHEDVSRLPLFILMGLMAAWLARTSGGLIGPIALHVFINGMAALGIASVTK